MAAPDTVVRIPEMFTRFDQHWSPKIVAEANGWHVKLVRAKGQFVWHTHDDVDEMFLVIAGTLTVHTRDRSVTLAQGDLFVVPRGVEHRPDAGDGCQVMLLEPAGVPNTGGVDSDLANADEWLTASP
jgi:mannose-6-phosphate isomerase-like protein (cupin superfamily)